MAQRASVKAVLGPTNTGKTHLAIERMLGHASGMIGLPLRLLAREVYDRVVAAKGEAAAALVTGEEKIWPDTARYFICTVEAMPLDVRTEFLAVDEIQVAADPDRGHIFTARLLEARGFGETMFLGSDTMRPMIRKLLPEAELIRRERMSTLTYAGARKITKLPKRSAVVAFSAEEVYAIAELLRRHRGGAAVVMGALSPRTRNAQVALYQSGEVDFLVATDAIGMGLNMDVDHVAFASRRKFDGHSWRDLRADEIAQIAGRAGRFTRDGAFGETGECPPFDEEIIERVEQHEFEVVEAVQWRNPQLCFDSVPALIASLEAPPQRPGLIRVRGADDETALKHVSQDAEIEARVRGPDDVARLWEVCQLPDFRKASPDEHARLITRIATHVLARRGRVPSSWVSAELEKLDRTAGDLDQLQARLAQVRTWTYAASRSDWLEDAGEWRIRTRDIEDKISDALHEALTQRFIDRRTSALLKGLKREDALLAGISAEGEVSVEGHFVGRLEGLEFKPDPRALGLEGRAVRNAAWRALGPEVAQRLRAVAEAGDDAFVLERDGRVKFDGAAIARVVPVNALLKPRIELQGGETAPEPMRAAARARVQAWLEACVHADLRPLVQLERAWREGRLPAAARGLAFRLIEHDGALDRAHVDLSELTPEARKALAGLGVRLGRHVIYMPALIKPRPARLMAILTHRMPRSGGAPFFLPRPGAISTPVDDDVSAFVCAAAGYLRCGRVAVRFDRVEVLAGAVRQAGEAEAGAQVTPRLASLIGRPSRDVPAVLAALGYREDANGAWRAPVLKAPRRKPARPDNAFAALADLVPAQPPKRRAPRA
ncbi:MAG: helicase-related protein [Hyphomonadaceae bacterium]|nr:helicase-related protein [Hyphomonadaceae bacterium]